MHKANDSRAIPVNAWNRHCARDSARQRIKKPIAALLCSLLCVVSLTSEKSFAFFGEGIELNERCTNQGRKPNEPFKTQALKGKNGCRLCHRNGIFGEGEGRTAYEQNNLDFFCVENRKNNPPVLDTIGDQKAEQGAQLRFDVNASDPEGDVITLTASGLPTGAVFNDGGNGSGVFSWIPSADQTGNRAVTFNAIDNGDPVASDSRTVNINIGSANQPPVLNPIGPRSATVLEKLVFTLSAADIDNNNLLYNVGNLPAGAEISDNGDGTALFSWVPQPPQVGSHRINVTVTDDGTPTASDTEEVTITVGNSNRPPVITSIGNQIVKVAETLDFMVTASDADGNAIEFTAGDLPVGASFIDNGNGAGKFSWTPTQEDVGNHTIAFVATDNGNPVASDSEAIIVTVTEPDTPANHPPVLNAIGNQQVKVGEVLNFIVTGADPDGDPLTFTAENLPAAATFIDLGEGAAEFSWQPGEEDFGSHAVTVSVTDDGIPPAEAKETFTIVVDEANKRANRPPVLNPVANPTIFVGDSVQVPFTATDPDGDRLRYLLFGMPATSTLKDNGDGTAVLSWVPAADDIGSHVFIVLVFDTGSPLEIDGQVVFIEVRNRDLFNRRGEGCQLDEFQGHRRAVFVRGERTFLKVYRSH